ncbi:MAG: DoxX family protein [Thermoanaerobaculia bacterium]
MTTLTQTWSERGTLLPLRSKVKIGLLWALQIGSAAMFLFAGSLKLGGAPQMVEVFGAIGVGQWFRYLTGAIEMVSAATLLIPSTARFGAAALALTMMGAIVTHLFIIGGSPAIPILLLASTSTIAWARRKGNERPDRRLSSSMM